MPLVCGSRAIGKSCQLTLTEALDGLLEAAFGSGVQKQSLARDQALKLIKEQAERRSD